MIGNIRKKNLKWKDNPSKKTNTKNKIKVKLKFMEADATLENTNKYLGTLTFEKIEAFPTSAPIPVFVD